MLFLLQALSLLSLAAATSSKGYSWLETVANLTVSSVSIDSGDSQHIVITNTSNLNQPSDQFIYQNNEGNQHFSNPKNLTIIPYFTYGVNVTSVYLNQSIMPQISSFGHYIDSTNHSGDVVIYDNKQVTINLTSTPDELAIKTPIPLAKIVAGQLCAAAEHNLPNDIVFIQWGDLHLRFSFSSTGLKTFTQEQVEIIENVFESFFLIHEVFGSIPGIVLNNFDGAGNHAYVTFGSSESEFYNIWVVDEETYARVALK
ncbi:hypothetical protein DASC09_014070 [Saccharomycopsis crataegensis]|uniref:Uncharacterized protein n=1 Tax=Saccharomycopsis crataegensis TaxID=43959 RepID=A0AAV5QHL1_9ASCO|nr:hypothetical protein DASC09_014070 [Saccharomycopsis crataegensis]